MDGDGSTAILRFAICCCFCFGFCLGFSKTVLDLTFEDEEEWEVGEEEVEKLGEAEEVMLILSFEVGLGLEDNVGDAGGFNGISRTESGAAVKALDVLSSLGGVFESF